MSTGSGWQLDGFGVEASYHASRIPGLRCSMLVDSGPPRACVYDRFVILAPTAGKALVWCRGETCALTPGSVLLVEPGDVQRDLRKSAYAAVTVELRRELAQTLRATSRQHGGEPAFGNSEWWPASPRVECAPIWRQTLSLVEAVREKQGRAVQEQLVTRLLGLLEPFWTRALPRPEPALVARARRALAEAKTRSLSLDELALRLRCAPSYLCRVFSAHTGMGPHTYQLQQRLLEAGRLIESGRSVASAATLTGFGDASHLRRHFRRRFAVAPGRYQKALAQGPIAP